MKNLITRFYYSFLQTFLVIVVLSCVSCGTTGEADQPSGVTEPAADSIIAFNQGLVKKEMQEIDDFISRYHWVMTCTQTGLRYMIYRHGRGPVAQIGDSVMVHYTISLLNGDQVYQSDPNKPVVFGLGKRDMPSGFEEGLRLMKAGDHARLIVPSHLAYGLLGDLEKIPSQATLVFDVELYDIKHVKK